VLQPKALDLNTVVASMGPTLRRMLGASDITVKMDLDPTARVIEADPGQIEQVILNLAANARDAMPRGGTLTIHTRNEVLERAAAKWEVRPGSYTLISVSDTGIGMDETTKAHLFEPYFTTKEQGKGSTGLGLSTVYGIVSQSGGHIGVHSSPGAGSTFVIHLPAAPPVVEAPRGEQAAAPSTTPSGTLLVAEDDDVLRGLIQAMLEEGGYDVITAGSGEEALEAAAAFDGGIDALVTDVVMPGMRGPDLAARLRSARPELRVVFVTGYGNHPFEQELRPGDTLLTKPFGMEALLSALGEVLPRGGARRTAP
jgi:two-component system, cell cycle sensor histidine kinase and response regulator CckA